MTNQSNSCDPSYYKAIHNPDNPPPGMFSNQPNPTYHYDTTTVVKETDPVNHPKHYTAHPSGVECIQITEHMNFNLGNAVKYLWRSDLKDVNVPLEDLQKAIWYIEREISRRTREYPNNDRVLFPDPPGTWSV